MILSRLPKTSPVPFLSVETPNIRLILNFMRDGHVDHQKYSEDVEKIQKEAQFCLLDGLDKFCISKTKLQKSTILVDSDDDIVRVIRESKKNAVLVVLYNSNPKEISEQVAEAVMLCGDKIDVCLKSCKERQGWLYMFHNKTTNKVSRATQLCYVSTTIENFINNIDQL
ncbi:hypothetical protein B9Z55_026068 [Caenorhabditis nigoni]|uniref:Uncharacterized protein n=1 Tax=Caenorhabditis nigoni TaxID=1611254 RepID=A0A2G5T134_9PELO|nr:hypothetical protein B9Z55_026068 [Caenorhabditis nigoni]